MCDIHLILHRLVTIIHDGLLEEGVQDLLHHLVVLLLGTQHLLQQLDQVRISDDLRGLVIAAKRADQHNTLEHYVILGVSIHQLALQEAQHIVRLHHFDPVVGRHVHHGAE